jgi:hypothetical protein
VKKGEKATPIVFWKVEQQSRQDGEQTDLDCLFMFRYYNVYALATLFASCIIVPPFSMSYYVHCTGHHPG